MANLTDLNTVIVDLFGVIGTLITEFVDLLTGDLIVLAVVGGFIALVTGIIALLYNYIKNVFSQSISKTKMK